MGELNRVSPKENKHLFWISVSVEESARFVRSLCGQEGVLAPRAQNQDRAKRVLAHTGSQGSVTKAQVVGSDGHPKGTRPQLFAREVHTLHRSRSPWQVSRGEHGAVLPSGNGRAQGETSQTHQQCRMGIRCVKAKNYRGNTPTFHKRPASSLTKSSDMEKRKLDELTYKGAGPRCGQASSEMVLPSLLTKRTDFLGCGKE